MSLSTTLALTAPLAISLPALAVASAAALVEPIAYPLRDEFLFVEECSGITLPFSENTSSVEGDGAILSCMLDHVFMTPAADFGLLEPPIPCFPPAYEDIGTACHGSLAVTTFDYCTQDSAFIGNGKAMLLGRFCFILEGLTTQTGLECLETICASDMPSGAPSQESSAMSSGAPSEESSAMPSGAPSEESSALPSIVPSSEGSDMPSDMSSSAMPTDLSSAVPSLEPSTAPSGSPTATAPSFSPTFQDNQKIVEVELELEIALDVASSIILHNLFGETVEQSIVDAISNFGNVDITVRSVDGITLHDRDDDDGSSSKGSKGGGGVDDSGSSSKGSKHGDGDDDHNGSSSNGSKGGVGDIGDDGSSSTGSKGGDGDDDKDGSSSTGSKGGDGDVDDDGSSSNGSKGGVGHDDNDGSSSTGSKGGDGDDDNDGSSSKGSKGGVGDDDGSSAKGSTGGDGRRLQHAIPVVFVARVTRECYFADCNEFATELVAELDDALLKMVANGSLQTQIRQEATDQGVDLLTTVNVIADSYQLVQSDFQLNDPVIMSNPEGVQSSAFLTSTVSSLLALALAGCYLFL